LRHDSCGESVIWSWQSIRQIDRHFGFVLIVLDTDVLALPENQFPTVSAVSDFVSELRRRIPGGEVQACPSPWGPR
jgi:hypothetical protein